MPQGANGNGACHCFGDFTKTCQCSSYTNTSTCATCPSNYVGKDLPSCEPCPGTQSAGNGSLTSACFGHGQCSLDGNTAKCSCDLHYGGTACQFCEAAYTHPSNTSVDCVPCPGVSNPDNVGPYSGGVLAVVCNYHGNCTEVMSCVCQTGEWAGPDCCVWQQCPSVSGWGFVGLITAVVVGLLLLVAHSGGPKLTYVVAMFVPSLQVWSAFPHTLTRGNAPTLLHVAGHDRCVHPRRCSFPVRPR